jgi:hypothetical protein
MNIDKEAEVIAGFTSKHILIISAGLVLNGVLSFIIYLLSSNFVAAFIFFMFIATNIVAAVKLSQNLPDGYFMNFLENRKLPKIYTPGDNNEPD